MSRARTPQFRDTWQKGTHEGKAKMDQGNLNLTPMVKARVPGQAIYKWEGPTHCLEITPPLLEVETERSHSALRLADLTSEEEDGLHRRISQYRKKVFNLLSEVSSLKNEVEFRNKEQQKVYQQVIAKHEEELAEVTSELKDPEWENTQLEESMEKVLEDTDYTSLQPNPDVLLRNLMETKRLSGSESSPVAHQEELLLNTLETFEATNRTLRRLIRDQRGSQVESVRLSEQKDTLLRRLTDMEALNAHLVVKLQEKEKEVKQLAKCLDTEKGNTRNTADLSRGLESTRAHLQGQLRSKEAENNQLTVQIKNLKRAVHQQRAEKDHLEEQLTRMKEQASVEREDVKRAARVQKQRAELGEDTAGQLTTQLLDMEKQVTDALSAAETWQRHLSEGMEDKRKMEVELSMLNCHVTDLTEQLQSTEDKGMLEREALLHQLHALSTESSAAKLENQSLRAKLPSVEKKLALCQSELQQVKASIKDYESLVDSYRVQVGNTRAEAAECGTQLAWAEREAQAVRSELEQEIEEVRRELLGRLAELEPLPEALRCSERQLQEAQSRESRLERDDMELSQTLAGLRLKVETQTSQMDHFRQRNKVLLEENRRLQQQVETLERQVETAGSENSNMLAVIAKREDSLHRNQLHLDKKTRECSVLSRKLEQAVDDARQQILEHSSTKEHSIQSKILGLETHLSRTTSEINQLRCNKVEMEQRYQIRLQDVKDLLEQSHSTNQSLQNYVQFLKASYSTVFGDMTLSTA